jgi:serine/threonine protein kinase/WD40 repeat protein
MSQSSTTHPSPELVQAYRSGKLPPVEAASIGEHLALCPTCRAAANPSESETVTPPAADPFATQLHRPEEDKTLDGLPTANPAHVPAALVDHPRYRVLQLLGTGGMGSVYKAEHRIMERLVALKVVNPSLFEEGTAQERFRQEVKTAAKLNHPNIVTAHDADQAGDLHFLVMEFVDGVSLGDIVKKQGRLSVSRACECIRQVALGLQHAFEKGMVHRDIKPHNLMLSSEGRIKILDFGLARFVSETGNARLTMAGSSQPGGAPMGIIMGTPDYIAPEQANDPRHADIRADIYSLGCTFYDLLTGQPPFPDGTMIQKVMAHLEEAPRPLAEFRDDVPGELATILQRMLAKDPKNRYQTPVELARDLSAFAAASSKPSSRRKPAEPVQAPKPADSHRMAPARKLQRASAPLAAAPPPKMQPKPERIESDRRTPRASKRESQSSWRHFAWAGGAGAAALFIAALIGIATGGRQHGEEPDPTPPKTIAKEPIADRVEPREAPIDIAPKAPDLKEAEPEARDPEPILKYPPLAGHKLAVNHAIISPDERYIASCSADRTIRMWDAETGRFLYALEGHADQVTSAAFHPDGRHLVSGSLDGTVRLWDLQPPGHPCVLLGSKLGQIRSVDVSPDGRLTLAAGDDKVISVCETLTAKPVGTLRGHEGAIFTALFGRSPAFAAGLQYCCYSGAADRTARIWDVLQGKEIAKFEHDRPVLSLAVAPDGLGLLSGTRDGVLRLWSLTDRQLLNSHRFPRYNITGIAYSPRGRYALFVMGGQNGRAGAWNPSGYCCMTMWEIVSWKEAWHKDEGLGSVAIMHMARAKETRMAVTSHYDNLVRVWKLAPGPTSRAAVDARLIIQSRDPSARVLVRRDGTNVVGPTVDRRIALPPGRYEIELAGEHSPTLRASPNRVELTAGGEKLIHIQHVQFLWPADALEHRQITAPNLSGIAALVDDDFHGQHRMLQGKDGLRTWGYANGRYVMHFPRAPLAMTTIPYPTRPLRDFACEVVARFAKHVNAGQWAMCLGDPRMSPGPEGCRGVELAIGNGQVFFCRTLLPTNFAEPLKPVLSPTLPWINSGEKPNTLLAILRGRLLEVYVNGVAVCHPFTLDKDYTPAEVHLRGRSGVEGLTIEFQRLRILPADSILLPDQRGAFVRD